MNKYATIFQGSDAVSRYLRKMDNRIESLRHKTEVKFLKHYSKGDLFDCTIGTGRLISELKNNVSSYQGMDHSQEFVAFVNGAQPNPIAKTGDLTQGIDAEADHYDTVICMRSISAIKHERDIIHEMIRITKPGGHIIFDYGTRPTSVVVRGELLKTDDASINAIIENEPVSIVKICRTDAILARIKRQPHVFRFLNGRFGFLFPNWLILAIENSFLPFCTERLIYCLIKHQD